MPSRAWYLQQFPSNSIEKTPENIQQIPGMIGDFDDDTHFCLKCHSTILGLDNYVSHRKAGCSKSIDAPKSPLPSQLLPPDESFGLKADDFFFNLELRSSSKKPSAQSTSGKSFSGILTRSKTTAVIQATSSSNKDAGDIQQSKSGKNVWIGGEQLKELGYGDNQSKLIKAVDDLERRKEEPARVEVYEDSEEDSEEYDYDDDSSDEDQDVPPRHYTGGKWKPSSPIQWSRNSDSRDWNVPPPSYTGGKWKPPTKRSTSPPATHTKGKWKLSFNAQKEYYDVPPASFTGSKWVSSKKQDDQDVPPPTHTKGKWRPRSEMEEDFPPPNHTKGKWRPKADNEDEFPPPGHTKGKWKPKSANDEDLSPTTKGKWKTKADNDDDSQGASDMKAKSQPSTSKSVKEVEMGKQDKNKRSEKKKEKSENKMNVNYIKGKWVPPPTSKGLLKISGESPLRKFGGTIQYWCSPCNRRLASKVVYERHLKSELHFKRTLHDREFDDNDDLNIIKDVRRAKIKPPEPIFSNQEKKSATITKKRNRKKIFMRCEVCQAKVNKYLIGKHLISHYHCRKGDITTNTARSMVLENIYGVVLECPFQCSICKFYCNTHEDFLRHWLSESHINKKAPGYFFCSLCKFKSEDTNLMYSHLHSPEHKEVVSVINRSVPIVIKKINPVNCLTCNKEFMLNMQLISHCKTFNHDDSNVAKFKNEYVCEPCGEGFSSEVGLQRHRQSVHQEKYFICRPCNMKFDDDKAAKLHRRTPQHKYSCLSKSEQAKANMKKKCEYCEETFANFLLLKEHLKEKHPEHKIRCPHCGANFTINQELTCHLRSKSCKFEENPENTFHCDRCPFSSNSTSELMFHSALHSEPLLTYPDSKGEPDSKAKPIYRYKCPVCEKMFPKSSLQAHIRIHTQERPFACRICNAKFARKNNLLFHVKNHTKDVAKVVKVHSAERPFLCSTCGANFKKKSILQQHMQIHTGKQCKCPTFGCVYTARKMSEMKDHLKTHSDAKDFACRICEYRGKTKQQLHKHMAIHDDLKKYQCPQCPFSTKTSTHLKRHARLHTGAKPFNCPYCAYKCNNLENLRKHILSTNKHPGKCIYECKFCSEDHFQSNLAKDFKAHLITSHPEMFGNGTEAATYVAGIYEAQDDSTYPNDLADMDQTSEGIIHEETPKMDECSESIMNLKTCEDPIVQYSDHSTKTNRALDQMLPMFIIPKEETVVVENSPEAWNLVGRYDVEEESGTLIPFQSDGVGLFQDHFD